MSDKTKDIITDQIKATAKAKAEAKGEAMAVAKSEPKGEAKEPKGKIITKINGVELTPYEIFKQVQTVLKVAKTKTNNFAKFNYRSVEDIFNAFKALGAPLTLVLSDETIAVGNKVFVEATATIKDLKGNVIEFAKASAELGSGKAGMSSEQATGSASSYARKYACNGLFLLDDTQDVDSMDNSAKSKVQAPAQGDNPVDVKSAISRLQELIRKNPSLNAKATSLLAGRSILKMSVADINAIIDGLTV